MTPRIIPVELFDLVVFGATGDLSQRKLLPALFHRDLAGQIPPGSRIIGCSRRAMTTEEFRAFGRKAIEDHVAAADRPPEMMARFLERLEQPEKNWKFSLADVKEREHWGEYMDAYEDMIRHTSTRDAPWYVIPADNKWFTRLVVAAAVIDALDSLDLQYPKVNDEKLADLAVAKKALLADK